MDEGQQQQQQEEAIASFCSVTGASAGTAQDTLSAADWNLQEAVALHFAYAATQDEENNDELYEDDAEPTPAASSLAPAAIAPTTASSSSSQRPRNPPNQRPNRMTMDELRKRGEQRDDDSEDDKPQDMFAGGEKSGLAVQNPGQSGGPVDHFRNIMNQARQNRDRPAAAGEETAAQPLQSANFAGRAQTLGGDDAPSQVIEDPLAPERPPRQGPQRVSRTLHLWADGISVDDGPLFRFDDPANQGIMSEINRGRAPMALLDVEPDEEVELNLEPHKDENYVQPKKKYKPFGGQGQRLGSPTPGPGTSASTAAPSQPTPALQNSAPAAVEVDESQPIIQLQIRLGDGARLQSRFNTTHTIGDVYNYVDRASTSATQRAYALMTTFPSKELNDKALVLGDMSDFKRGGVVVQKWK